MSSPDALTKIEQAKALIDEAKSLVQDRNNADAKEVQELNKKLREKDRQLLQKDRDLKRKDQELTRKSEQLNQSKQPVKTFIVSEIRKSYKSVAEAKHAHATSPSKYSAGLIELAKGSHAENEETFKKLADVVGIDFSTLDLKLEELEVDEKPNGVLEAVVKQEKKIPREQFHLSRYVDRSKKLQRRDSGTVV